MKKLIIYLILLGTSHSKAFVVSNPNYSGCTGKTAALCAYWTTVSLPTVIVEESSGEEVWNVNNEELLAHYRSELNGLNEVYYIQRYANIRTNGDVEAAKVELIQNFDLLDKNK